MSEKKNKKSSGKKSNSEALKEMREKKSGKTAKEVKTKKKDNLVVMRGFDMLPPLKPEERQEKAKEIDTEFRAIDKDVRAKGLQAGILLREMKGYELWKELKSAKTTKAFTSFDAWLKEAAPVSRAGGYAQLKVAEKLLPYIPKEELAEYPDYARKVLTKVPKIHFEKVDSPLRKAAKTTKSEKDFVETVQKHAPEAHVESTRTIKTNGAGVIDDMLAAAMAIGEVPKGEALEYVASDWLDSPCTREDYVGMTNRQAWYAITQQGKTEEQAG